MYVKKIKFSLLIMICIDFGVFFIELIFISSTEH